MSIEWEKRGYSWNLDRKRMTVSATELYRANFLVAVSLRNPAFSNEWLTAVLDEIKHLKGAALLCLVDTPYFASVTAREYSRKELQRQIDILLSQRTEQNRRLQGLIQDRNEYVSYYDWNSLLSLTPKSLADELVQAFNRSGDVKESIISQVRKVFPDEESDESIIKLSRFFVEEIPVLVFIYYVLFPGCIDVYPGPQADFFWKLDLGEFHDELPSLSALAANSDPHTYLRVWRS
jgi:hypothetical protein